MYCCHVLSAKKPHNLFKKKNKWPADLEAEITSNADGLITHCLLFLPFIALI